MKMYRDFLKMIILAAKGTVEHELSCEECWEEVDRFAESTLAGKDVSEAHSLVKSHLNMCPECGVEFNALLNALRATALKGVYRQAVS